MRNKPDEKILILFLLGFSALGYAQILPFEHYSIKDGLASNWITSIFQDARGYLWIGGDEGVSVYDGVTFKNYGVADGLPVSHVWRVYESRRSPGTMWIGTHRHGAVKFAQGKFTSLLMRPQPVAYSATYFYEDHDGILWCGTGWGVYQIRGDSLAFFSTGSDSGWAPFITQTRDSLIWISIGKSLHRYSPRTRQTTRLDPPIAPVVFTCMLQDDKGDIWIGDEKGTVHRWRNDRLVASLRLPFGELRQVVDDGEGSLWFATPKGVIKVSKQNFTAGGVTSYTTENGLHDYDIIACQRDREGNLWFGSRANGLVKLSDRQVYRFPLSGLRPDVMNRAAVTDARGRIFVVSETGIWEIWRKTSGDWDTHLHQLDTGNLLGRYWQAELDKDGVLWISFEEGGLAGYQINMNGEQHSILVRTRTLRPGHEMPEGFPIAHLVDDRRQLWSSMRSVGVAHVDLNTSTLRAFYKSQDGMPYTTIRAIFREPEDRIWFGGYINGIAIFDIAGDTLRLTRKLTTAEGLPDNQIRFITQRRNGEIWIGTRFGGVAIYDQGKIDTISTKDGLLSDAVWGFAEDDSGRMWIATSVGIQMTAAAHSRELVTVPILRGQYFGSVGIAPGNLVWGLSYKELVVYDFSRRHDQAAPLIYLTDLYVKGEKRPLADQAEFSYNENSCTLSFIGISFKNEKALRYRYRLHGLDDEWQGPTSERTVRFAALPAGTYTFEAVAINAEGVASAAPAAFTFTISPPFWQRWWFIAFCVLILGSILYAAHVVRLDRLLEIEKIRSRIATDLHDDIGAGLTHIGLLSQVVLHKKGVQQFYANQPEHNHHEAGQDLPTAVGAIYELGGSLERVGGVARELSADMSDVVWSINPQHDSGEALQRRLSVFAHEICRAKDIVLNFEVSEQMAGIKLHPELRRNLLLIAKEALHNAVKYSGSPNVAVKFATNGKHLIVEIADCGKGFELASAKNGNGLNNIRSRAEKLGGSCEIISTPGQGTRVTARVPYK
jgi:signal transduction histidine kinase/ligand-binding sensor domain-containing protein